MGLDTILLAAGNAKRFLENKLLYEVQGAPMIALALEKLSNLQQKELLSELILVTQYQQVADIAEQYVKSPHIVWNKSPDMGITYSMRLGMTKLLEIKPNSKAVLFMVGDQPYLQGKSIEGLIQFYHEKNGIVVSANGEMLGNPVIFPRKYYDELSALHGDKGGKQVLLKHMEDVYPYQIAKKELEDIDVKQVLKMCGGEEY